MNRFLCRTFPERACYAGCIAGRSAWPQAGGILILSTVEDPRKTIAHTFLKIDNVKFKQKVVPGDTLILKCNLISPVRRGICHMRCVGYVGSKVVIESELMAQIVKNRVYHNESTLSLRSSPGKNCPTM
jgi:UDP-3-O-[3-hydroxymyristoyl] N-acetylglucosamine deacetylase / 3-hydroxyacyl-[acyl-carrier-protein] dehydratase